MVAALSVPKEFFQGVPKHFAFQGVTTPGIVQTLLTVLNPANMDRDLYQVVVVCEFSGIILVKLDGIVIGSGRTGPGEKQALIPWTPPYPSLSEQTILVTFQQRSSSPVVPVEAYLATAEIELF